jgi:HAD superfamily hydrolase (TIGR01459 family)
MPVPIIAGLSELADRFAGFVLDVWGVVHQGGEAYPEAIACLEALRRRGLAAVFLSNAPRRAARVEALLATKGIPRELHRGVVTSGEVARHALERRAEPHLAALGPAYFMLGAARDGDLLDGLPYCRAARVADADFVLAIGLDEGNPTVAAHEPVLREAAARGLPLLCINPDRVVVHLGVRELCAGALAARYLELGGTVHFFGKPHGPAYGPSLARLGLAPGAPVLAVGDGLETDIRGAAQAGLATLFVTGGILADALGVHREELPPPALLERAFAEADIRPDAVIPVLRW